MVWCMDELPCRPCMVSLFSINTVSMCTQFLVSLFSNRSVWIQHVEFATLSMCSPEGVQGILSRGGSNLRRWLIFSPWRYSSHSQAAEMLPSAVSTICSWKGYCCSLPVCLMCWAAPSFSRDICLWKKCHCWQEVWSCSHWSRNFWLQEKGWPKSSHCSGSDFLPTGQGCDFCVLFSFSAVFDFNFQRSHYRLSSHAALCDTGKSWKNISSFKNLQENKKDFPNCHLHQ